MSERVLTVVYLHGIKFDDPDARWRAALDRVLARSGAGTLSDREIQTGAPSWLGPLEGPEPEEDPGEPPLTYRPPSQEHFQWVRGDYFKRLTDLYAHVAPFAPEQAGPVGAAPAEQLAKPALSIPVFRDAERYCASAARRNACLHAVLEQLPATGDVVLIAHSLGSVLATDLLYYLPPALTVRLFLTIGSPLAHRPVRSHLKRLSDRPPLARMGSWLNLVGKTDLVCAGRGINKRFPEALDLFVPTGNDVLKAHDATSYLDQDVIAHAIKWVEEQRRERPATRNLPEVRIPEWVLRVAAGTQFSLRLEQSLPPGDTRVRFGQARQAVIADLRRKLHNELPHALNEKLGHDNGQELCGRFTAPEAIGLMLGAAMNNPVPPYEIQFPDDAEAAALGALAVDLGYPPDWAKRVLQAEQRARQAQDVRRTWTRRALVGIGVVAILAAPALVLAAAPAGAAGAAAVTGGLAALGPGGMMGGIGVVSAVGGAGGLAIREGLIAGSAESVQETVIFLHALAIASHHLDEPDASYRVWFALVTMQSDLGAERARLASVSDPKAPTLRELDRKITAVGRALKALEETRLSPFRLGPG